MLAAPETVRIFLNAIRSRPPALTARSSTFGDDIADYRHDDIQVGNS
jgi:hypothetical protein